MKRLLEVYNLVKVYTLGFGRRRVVAVNNVSFDIGEAEFAALVGESGSGKTTIAKIILRLTPPTSGSVIYKGKNVWSLTNKEIDWYRSEVQGVFQDPYTSFNPFYKVDRALKVAVEKFLGKNVDADEVIRKVLWDVRLNPDEVLGRYPHQLSGGQLQRISIARALIPRPKLLIADEYISMVDMSTRVDIVNLSRNLVDNYKMSIIMITHEMNMALYATDKIIVLYRGKVMEMGRTRDVMRKPLNPYTMLLMEAIPSIGVSERKILRKTIETAGQEGVEVTGCPFAPRCPYAFDKCYREEPQLIEVEPGHYVACWLVSI